MDGVVWALAQATHELALFAAVGLALGGVDDLLVDLIWMLRTAWRRLTVYRRHDRVTAADLAGNGAGTVAVFIPAWREAGVIGPMVATALSRWAGRNVHLYIGCYPNDPDTIDEVRRIADVDHRVRLVINPRGIM